MKKLLSLLLAITPIVAYCDDKNTLNGNWKEVSRITGGKAVSFKDTIKVQFLMGGEYVWQKSGGFIYKGTYKIKGSELDMGSRFFSIVSRTDNSLKLKDETGTYELVPFNPADGQAVLPAEKPAAPVTSLNQMKGHWSVFKGTLDKKVPAIDYKRKIKILEITGDVAGDGKLGMAFGSYDPETVPSWYVESFSNQKLYLGGKDKRVFNVLKCEDNQLVIEEDGMTYFMRKFK